MRKTVYQGNGAAERAWTLQAHAVFRYDLSAGQADGWNLIAELNANSSNEKIRTYVCGSDLSGLNDGHCELKCAAFSKASDVCEAHIQKWKEQNASKLEDE